MGSKKERKERPFPLLSANLYNLFRRGSIAKRDGATKADDSSFAEKVFCHNSGGVGKEEASPLIDCGIKTTGMV